MALRDGIGWRTWVTVAVALAGAGVAAPFAGCEVQDSDASDLDGGDGGRNPGQGTDSGSSDAGAANPSDSDQHEAGSGTKASTDGGVSDAGVVLAFADADAAPEAATPDNGSCVPDYGPCAADGGMNCCNLACTSGACGGSLAEGERCDYDGGTVPSGATPCHDKLACNHGYCGTSACVPDGTGCGPDAGGVVCCNDNCNGVTCGGS